jgi:hypothetical protein
VKVNRSLVWCPFEPTLIMVQAPGLPDDADWTEYLAESERAPTESVLIVVGDARLSPKQRVDVQRMQERHGTRGVVVTDSMIARGICTALHWFGVKVQAFATRDMNRALVCAGVGADRHTEAEALIARMTSALGERREQSDVTGTL